MRNIESALGALVIGLILLVGIKQCWRHSQQDYRQIATVVCNLPEDVEFVEFGGRRRRHLSIMSGIVRFTPESYRDWKDSLGNLQAWTPGPVDFGDTTLPETVPPEAIRWWDPHNTTILHGIRKARERMAHD